MVKDKLAIKENFDDDDLSDDVDDEVFVRDGKKGILKMEKHKCDERPLMPMRRKSKAKTNGSSPEVRSRQPCNIYNCLLPVYFAIAAIISIGFLMMLYIFLVDKLPLLVGKVHWWSPSMSSFGRTPILAPCSNFKLDPIWTTNVAAAISDSQIELIDIDRDNVSDIVIGVAAKWKDFENSDVGCAPAVPGRNSLPVCNGGVVAINGRTGSTLWRQQVSNAVLDVQCRLEINGDGISDCVLTGKGLLAMLNGADGKILWQRMPVESSYDLYNALVIRDVNFDGYVDILAARYRPNADTKRRSEIEIISGAEGHSIAKVAVFETILHPPQILVDADGFEVVCFFTGSLEEKGAIFVISLHDLVLENEKKIQPLYHFDSSILAAPLLVHSDSDGFYDLVFVAGANVYLLEGNNLQLLWNVSLSAHVDPAYRIFSISSPTATYFNDDWVPDLLITLVVGSTYPNWFYSLIVVLDGKTGNLLSEPFIRSGIVDAPGGISLSFEGRGNDAFVYWTSSCKNYTGFKKQFLLDHNVRDLRFVDLCHLRFNASTRLELYALNQHVKPPGSLLLAEESRREDSSKNADYVELDSSPFSIFESLLEPAKNTIYEKGDQNTNEDWESRQKMRYPRPLISNSAPSNLKSNAYNVEEDDRENSVGRNAHIQFDEIIPKTSSSAVLSRSINDLGLDLIVSHYQVPANPNECVTIDQRRRCLQKVSSGRGRDSYNLIENLELRQAILSTVSVSRYRLSCSCQLLRKENMEVCSRLLPYEMQSYPVFKGSVGNAAYLKREKLT